MTEVAQQYAAEEEQQDAEMMEVSHPTVAVWRDAVEFVPALRDIFSCRQHLDD